jgi:hypothetical protein
MVFMGDKEDDACHAGIQELGTVREWSALHPQWSLANMSADE